MNPRELGAKPQLASANMAQGGAMLMPRSLHPTGIAAPPSIPPSRPQMRRSRTRDTEIESGAPLFLACMAYCLPIAILYFCVVSISDGNFTYTLDDPYIHLALARNIWAGNYGINPSEASAPSSSIIWPFLLSPFSAIRSLFELAPLLINTICAAASGFVLSNTFPELNKRAALVFSLALMTALNIYGLVFTGMEHSLQVLLVLVITSELLRDKSGSINKPDIRPLFYICALILPLVRYEGLAISVPALLYAMTQEKRRYATLAFAAMTASLLLFSFYLDSRGLGFMPSSVLAKLPHIGLESTIQNLQSNIAQYGLLMAVAFVVCQCIWSGNRALALVLAGATILHFLFGKHGWFGRYEVYYIVFISLFFFKTLTRKSPKRWVAVFMLPFVFPSLTYATAMTPLAASNIYNQQARMAAIAKLLNDRVAVNDLGLMALRSGNYVLDLWGLGSIEALTNRRRPGGGVEWISALMKRKNVSYAFVYDCWFPQRPADWKKVAELKLLQRRITPASDTVSLYATSAQSAKRLRRVIRLFSGGSTSRAFSVTLQPGEPHDLGEEAPAGTAASAGVGRPP